MKRLQSIRLLSPVAVLLVLFYVALAVVASGCLFDHPVASESGHHHPSQQSSKAVHSALCAWACQANPGTALASAVPLVQPFWLLSFGALAALVLLPGSHIVCLRSRGPPRSV